MNLYKIYQEVNNNYDTYDSAVVCAENETEAVKIYPDDEYPGEEQYKYDYKESGEGVRDTEYGSWVKKKYVKVQYLGIADKSIKKGVIVSSFNAG